MAQVDIVLNQHRYTIACDDEQVDRLREMADVVDKSLRELAAVSPQGTTDGHMLALIAIMMADQADEAKTRVAELEVGESGGAMGDEALMVEAVQLLTSRIDALADRLEQA